MTIDEVREILQDLAWENILHGRRLRFRQLFLALLDVYEHGQLHDVSCPDPDCKECAARKEVQRILEEMDCKECAARKEVQRILEEM